jgi:hypothetical protein
MGLNVDLTQMLGAPSVVSCPRCKADVATNFDDYDIECGNPNPSAAEWRLRCHCDDCELDFYYKMKVVKKDVKLVRDDT